jgi:D-glycero-alpha-D-manno-heptose-7-phosphate kinase
VRPGEIAYAAHRLEVDVLGSESGIQDHLSAAYGGINYIEVDDYPVANVVALPVWEDLTPLLSLVYLGRPHNSTSVHRQVIETLQQENPGVLSLLREAAIAARDAVIAQDLRALGHAMISNTEAQRALHPAIVGTDAARVIRAASDHEAVGWKVNGAGGDGGSLTILSATTEARAALEDRIAQLDPRYRLVRVEISAAGLRVNDSPGD